MSTLVLSAADIERAVDLDDLRSAMRRALADVASGRAESHSRHVVRAGPATALGFMPAFSLTQGLMGYKVVSVAPANARAGLNPHQGLVSLLDPATGVVLAILEGTVLTALRTAAVSAAATEALSRTEASVLGLIGAGRQAFEHVRALRRVRSLKSIVAWSRSAASSEALGRKLSTAFGETFAIAPSPEAVAREADLLVTCTASREELVSIRHVRAGSHVCAIGACRPDQAEIRLEDRAGLKIFMDSADACLLEAAEITDALRARRLSSGKIVGEIGALLSGTARGRSSPEDVTVFKSVGLGVEDLFAAESIYRRALALGIGTRIEFSEGARPC